MNANWNSLLSKKQRYDINRVKKYYEKNKNILKDKARDKYRDLLDEEKNIKIEYGRNRYYNMSEEKRQKLKEYQKEVLWG